MQQSPNRIFTEASPQIFHDIEQGTSQVIPNYFSQRHQTYQSEAIRLGPEDKPIFHHLNPLEAALLFDRVKLAKSLIAHINPAENNSLSLSIAAGRGHIEMVNELLKDGRVDPTHEDTNESLCWAIQSNIRKKNCRAIALQLLELPQVDPSAYWDNAMITASECGNTYMVDVLANFKEVNPGAINGLSIQSALANAKYPTAIALYLHIRRKGQDPYKGLSQDESNKLQTLVISRAIVIDRMRTIIPKFTSEGAHPTTLCTDVLPLIFSNLDTHGTMSKTEIQDLSDKFAHLSFEEKKDNLKLLR